ncbi:MAG: hypothetical protein WC937_05665 [Candidatus Omnitrophota bacterium]|jgi:hypothetical protein|nr:hypothetical protein [Candidatus Omnitrophota bacterium]MDD5518185.1 hypothetical protein [Candidatus Omnitrophota bacterium]
MKLNKFLSMIVCVTLFSLLYVYQQTEILRLAYSEQRQYAVFQKLLDRNSILRYNIEKNCSLVNIGGSVSNSSDFQMPDKYQLARLVPSKEGVTFTQGAANKETLLARIFGIKRQAEARTINP